MNDLSPESSPCEANWDNDTFREAFEDLKRRDHFDNTYEKLIATDYFKFGWEAALKAIDVDWLAQVIRTADGNNSLGAGALAEKIIEAVSLTRRQQRAAERKQIVTEMKSIMANVTPSEDHGNKT